MGAERRKFDDSHGKNMKTRNHPLISVVTATYNAVAALGRTATSLRMQSFRDFEWIVIDGGSTDGTVAAILENEDLIAYWKSERDKGIYDAWNKASGHIKGDWVLFLGAGDQLAAPEVFEQVSTYLTDAYPQYELVYGILECTAEGDDTVIERVERPWSEIKGKWQFFRPMLPMHPEVFQHRTLFESEKPFDDSLRIAADSKFMLSSVLKKDPLYIPVLVSRMPSGGVSTQLHRLKEVANEISIVNQSLGIHPPFLHSVKERIKLSLKLVLAMFPRKVGLALMDIGRLLMGKGRKWTV